MGNDSKKVDILAIGPHPDDMEIFMGGSLLKWVADGQKTAICDLTQGEMSTNGDVETRAKEAKKAADLLGLSERRMLSLNDGSILNTDENRRALIDVIRELRPEVVFTTMEGSRHPDHHHAYQLIKDACFLSGLVKIKSNAAPHRPSNVIQTPEFFLSRTPSFVVDISSYYEKKKEVVQAYASQVLMPGEADSKSNTLIKSNEMWDRFEARAKMAGAMIGVKYGEPFYSTEPLRVDDAVLALSKRGHR